MTKKELFLSGKPFIRKVEGGYTDVYRCREGAPGNYYITHCLHSQSEGILYFTGKGAKVDYPSSFAYIEVACAGITKIDSGSFSFYNYGIVGKSVKVERISFHRIEFVNSDHFSFPSN